MSRRVKIAVACAIALVLFFLAYFGSTFIFCFHNDCGPSYYPSSQSTYNYLCNDLNTKNLDCGCFLCDPSIVVNGKSAGPSVCDPSVIKELRWTGRCD